jgi:sugar lactone lactonase YvrE
VTDPVLGQIWQVSAEGEASVLLQHPLLEGDPNDPALLFRPLGVNGIAVGPNNRTLYVSNTDQGSVLRVSPNSPNPTAEVFVQDARLRGADGFAFDRAGRLLVTVNASDTLLAVTRQRRIVELAEGGLLDSPSSVVFGATRADRQTLYLASSAFSRILGLKPGSPQPALLAARVRTPGLPLP